MDQVTEKTPIMAGQHQTSRSAGRSGCDSVMWMEQPHSREQPHSPVLGREQPHSEQPHCREQPHNSPASCGGLMRMGCLAVVLVVVVLTVYLGLFS